MMAARSPFYYQLCRWEQKHSALEYLLNAATLKASLKLWEVTAWREFRLGKALTLGKNRMLALFAMRRDAGRKLTCFRTEVIERSRLSILAIAQQWHF